MEQKSTHTQQDESAKKDVHTLLTVHFLIIQGKVYSLLPNCLLLLEHCCHNELERNSFI